MWCGRYGEVVVIFSHSNLPCGVVSMMKGHALMFGLGCNNQSVLHGNDYIDLIDGSTTNYNVIW